MYMALLTLCANDHIDARYDQVGDEECRRDPALPAVEDDTSISSGGQLVTTREGFPAEQIKYIQINFHRVIFCFYGGRRTVWCNEKQ